MERIATLLEKIKELNGKPGTSVIEIDLMMDYTRVLYADLLEWRNKVSFTSAVAMKNEPASADAAVAMEEHYSTERPEITAPAIELDSTSRNYASEKAEKEPAGISFPDPHYATADIRQQIGINDKYQFISELFGNNKDAYEEVISEINTFDTEEEALSWLNDTVCNQFQWKDDMEAVHSFYKLLNDFFASR